MDGGTIVAAIDAVAHEVTLFACVGFLIGGIDDLAVDLIFAARSLRKRRGGFPNLPSVADLPTTHQPHIAIFIAAWDEANVIGQMLRAALARIDYSDYTIHVGTYPNDRATIAAVAEVAAQDLRVRLIIGDHPGPTTKADCLNAIWRAMLADEAGGVAAPRIIVIHDAEDVIHREELRVHAALMRDHDLVQLPVIPLTDNKSRLVAGHYADEFAEAHSKLMPVRQAIGAAIPLAGVGCGIRTEMLRLIATDRSDDPFDRTSLTEDYEMGLTVARLGGRATFAQVAEFPGGPPVAVRAYFPDRLNAAVRQKARWMVGIALAGWDRIGWAQRHRLSDHWMRMRDRRALLSMIVLFAGYIGIIAGGAAMLVRHFTPAPAPAMSTAMQWLLVATLVLLTWRLAVRAAFTWRLYGPREAMLSVPRAMVGNLIALLAARRALWDYVAMLFGRAVVWDKTEHHFPDAESEALQR